MNIFEALDAARVELCGSGIGKDQKAPANIGGYAFRGIDDIYNVIGPLLAKYKITFTPMVENVEHTPYQTTNQQGQVRTTHHYLVTVTYLLTCSETPEMTTQVKVYGEAADTADKGMNKAMTSAYKNAVFQTFAPPLKGVPLDMDQRTTVDEAGPIDSESTAEPEMGEPVATAQQEAEVSQEQPDMTPVREADPELHNELTKLVAAAQASLPAIYSWVRDSSNVQIVDLGQLPNCLAPALKELLEKQRAAKQAKAEVASA